MHRLRLAALAVLPLLAALPGATQAQGDPRLTILGSGADVMVVVGNGATPVPLLRRVTPDPGSAGDGAPVAIAGSEPSQCARSRGVAIHPNGRFVFLTSDATPVGVVCAYALDPVKLVLAPVPGSPYSAGHGTRAIVVDPAGKFVYAANFADGTISGFGIDEQTGELRPLGSSPYVSADSNTGFIAIDPRGRFLYSSNSDPLNPSVSGFAIDRDNGGLTPVPFSPLPQKSTPGPLAVDPRGRFLFVAASPNLAYAIQPTTGQITATTDTFGPFPLGMALDPAGRFLYTTSGTGTAGRLNAYRVAGSSVTPIGSIATGDTPQGVAVARTGRHVYAANAGDGTIAAFRVDDASGALAPIAGSPFAGGDSASALAVFGALDANATWRSGEPLARPLGVFGGRLPYTWTLTQGALPPGLDFVADLGLVAGTPTVPGSYAFTARVTDAYGGGVSRDFTFTVKDGAAASTATVIEYYHAELDHYFITWIADEIAALDAGTTIRGWARTGKRFSTYSAAQAGTSSICRFYIPPALGDSHFFGRGTAECNATAAAQPDFVLEDPAYMQMILPAAGACPAGIVPVYRVFSNRADANHRYTIDRATRDLMVTRGWIAEGDGPDLVVMCAPP